MNGPNQSKYGANYHSSVAMGLAFCFFAFAIGMTLMFRFAPVAEPAQDPLAMAPGTSPAGTVVAQNETLLGSQGELPNEALINNVPFESKLPDFGGEACVAMFLKAMGQKVDQDVVFDAAGVDPVLGRGCYTPELTRACQKIGFETGEVGYLCTDKNREQLQNKTWDAFRKNIATGVGSVVCWHNEKGVENFILVLGIDNNRDILMYHDPNKAT